MEFNNPCMKNPGMDLFFRQDIFPDAAMEMVFEASCKMTVILESEFIGCRFY